MASMTWAPFMATLLFLEASHPVEACSCLARHLQTDYCRGDIVIKGTFLNATGYDPDDMSTPIKYDVKILEVFKGEKKIKNLEFISQKHTCSFELSPSQFNKVYLIPGFINDGQVQLTSCDYIVPWSLLSQSQKNGIQGAYSKGCSCQIKDQVTVDPDSEIPSDTCLHDSFGDQGNVQTQRCAPDENDICIWENIQY